MIPVRILHGRPDDAELAALVIVLVAAAGDRGEERSAPPDWVMSDVDRHPAASWTTRPGPAWW